MSSPNLTPTSYLVLGLVAWMEPATPYDLKQACAGSIGNFWPFPHTQLYTEPARLAELGLLTEEREESGRRRRRFSITPAGRAALGDWLSSPETNATEIRDAALLKLFFAGHGTPADIAGLAEAQVAAHRAKLEVYEEIRDTMQAEAQGAEPAAGAWPGDTPFAQGARARTLSMGLIFERAAVRYWESVARDPELAGPAPDAG